MTQERPGDGVEKGRGGALKGVERANTYMWVSDGCSNLTHTTLPDYQPSYTWYK